MSDAPHLGAGTDTQNRGPVAGDPEGGGMSPPPKPGAWRQDLTTALRLFLGLALLLGGGYTLAVWGIARTAFPYQANGELVQRGGRVIGSELVGQYFSGPGWFHGRPSATVDAQGRLRPYDANNSGGSDLGPSNPALVQEVRGALASEPGVPASRVPASLVESSGSGLDPDIAPAAALLQVPRVAAARGVPAARLKALVRQLTRGRWLGLFGSAHVNVLELNLAVARLAAR